MPLSLDIGPRINKVAISDELIARFKELIERRVFVPGNRLPPERDLAEALAVSRPTLRQALRALQIMGVIKARQGSGSYLADSASDIMRVPLEFALALKNVAKTDLFETRRTLEVELASLAAERRTNDDLQAMRRALGEMEKGITLIEWFAGEGLRMGGVTQPSELSSSYRSHENIYVEIDKQDSTAAAKMMMEHFALIEKMAKQRTKPVGTASIE